MQDQSPEISEVLTWTRALLRLVEQEHAVPLCHRNIWNGVLRTLKGLPQRTNGIRMRAIQAIVRDGS
jgi:hypothetical protein